MGLSLGNGKFLGIHLLEIFHRPVLRQFLVAGVFFLVLLGYTFSDKISVAGGFGWDGAHYGLRATDFFPIFQAKLNAPGTVQRLLPSALVYFAFQVLGIKYTNYNVIQAFTVINAFSVTMGFHYFLRLVSLLSFGFGKVAVAFSVVFLSFFILKFESFYPVLTDGPAFGLGLASIFYFMANRRLKLAFTLLLTALTWPSGLASGVFLLLFPRGKQISLMRKGSRIEIRGAVRVALYASFFFLLDRTQIIQRTEAYGDTVIDRNLLFLSAALLLYYLDYVVISFFDSMYSNGENGNDLRLPLPSLRGAILAGIVLILLKIVVSTGTADVKSDITWMMVKHFFNQSLVAPGHAFVAHFIFWGPAYCLLLLYIPKLFKSLQSDGIGVQLFVLSSLILMIDSESRHHVFHLPALFILLVRVLELNLSRAGVGMVVLLHLVWSKFWIPFDMDWLTPGWSFQRFPWQFYAMHQGPWLARSVYEGFAVAMVICMVIFVIYLKVARSNRLKGTSPGDTAKSWLQGSSGSGTLTS